MSDKPMFERLAESVGPMAHLPNNGAAYHTGEQIITHLNRALGPGNWSYRILDQGEESDSDECWAFCEITAIIEGVTVVKQDYGSQAFKKSRQTGKYVSKWDDKKAAMTDALKRAARLFGVGLDAWANERAPSWRPEEHADERREVEAEMRDASRPKPRPTVPPTPIRDAAVLTGAAPLPEQAVSLQCGECKALVPEDGTVNIQKNAKGDRVDVSVADFGPVCADRLGRFYCGPCYDKQYWKKEGVA